MNWLVNKPKQEPKQERTHAPTKQTVRLYRFRSHDEVKCRQCHGLCGGEAIKTGCKQGDGRWTKWCDRCGVRTYYDMVPAC
jgi:Pyruvate/2-oxoacid:ferredoxin oxidoreductase delta subunit